MIQEQILLYEPFGLHDTRINHRYVRQEELALAIVIQNSFISHSK